MIKLIILKQLEHLQDHLLYLQNGVVEQYYQILNMLFLALLVIWLYFKMKYNPLRLMLSLQVVQLLIGYLYIQIVKFKNKVLHLQQH